MKELGLPPEERGDQACLEEEKLPGRTKTHLVEEHRRIHQNKRHRHYREAAGRQLITNRNHGLKIVHSPHKVKQPQRS